MLGERGPVLCFYVLDCQLIELRDPHFSILEDCADLEPTAHSFNVFGQGADTDRAPIPSAGSSLSRSLAGVSVLPRAAPEFFAPRPCRQLLARTPRSPAHRDCACRRNRATADRQYKLRNPKPQCPVRREPSREFRPCARVQ